MASYDVNQERKMLERMEESTEQILVVLGKDTATGISLPPVLFQVAERR